MLCVLFTRIMAAIFDFMAAKDWGEEEICTKGAVDGQKQALNAMLSDGLCKPKITVGDM